MQYTYFHQAPGYIKGIDGIWNTICKFNLYPRCFSLLCMVLTLTFPSSLDRRPTLSNRLRTMLLLADLVTIHFRLAGSELPKADMPVNLEAASAFTVYSSKS